MNIGTNVSEVIVTFWNYGISTIKIVEMKLEKRHGWKKIELHMCKNN